MNLTSRFLFTLFVSTHLYNLRGQIDPVNQSEQAIRELQSKHPLGAVIEPITGASKVRSDYAIATLDYNRRVYEWQLWSSRLIFITVLVIVYGGLLLTMIQFSIAAFAIKRHSRAAATEVRASLTGIHIKSSVIGLSVLGLALLFF
jgi:hypothetical protein